MYVKRNYPRSLREQKEKEANFPIKRLSAETPAAVIIILFEFEIIFEY